ncbi:hypothetical protein E3N88_20709 [Mikania micrantha]|uniref:Cytochrome P450 n=1 Tax=Mikania micrantha TaxID=192012 RepID=A0A5N6NHR4_9ASTR|nr:hypothetical protein E3N88_20709 [Mikania micrantha]
MDYACLFITLALLAAGRILFTHFRRNSGNLPPTIFPTLPISGHLHQTRPHPPPPLRIPPGSLEVLSSHRLNEFHDIRADEGRLMIRKIISVGSSPVNLTLMLHEMTLNMIMRMISGKRYFGGEMEEEGKRFKEIVKETFMVSGASNLGDHLPFLRWLGMRGLEKKMIVLQEKNDSFIQELIDQLRKLKGNNDNNKEKKKNTMIEVLLQLKEDDPHYYTDELIRSLIKESKKRKQEQGTGWIFVNRSSKREEPMCS